MSDILSFLLPENWIATLLKQLDGLSGQRRQALDRLFFEFGDWKELTRLYIEPDAQIDNPADWDERQGLPMWVRRIPIREWINQFLEKRFKTRNGHNTLFVLADAGMGKTSLLTMLKLNDLQRFWPKGLRLELLKLGPDTLGELETLRDRASSTVLLLDSLDEDPEAHGKVGERIQSLLHEVTAFRHCIITCRTQYFPRVDQGESASAQPQIEPGRIQLGGYECNLLYLSPFNRKQIEEYLRRTYPDSLRQRVSRWLLRQPDRRDKIRGVIESMGDLSMRPLLLAYVDDLVDRDFGPRSEYAIYERLVDRWLQREVRKLTKAGIEISKEELWKACTKLAIHLQSVDARSLNQGDLDQTLGQGLLQSAFGAFSFGGRSLLNRNGLGDYRFAHYSVQEYLVARAIVLGFPLPDGRLRMTLEILSFAVSAEASGISVDLPLAHLDLEGVDLAKLAFSPLVDRTHLAALAELEPDARRQAYLQIHESLSPGWALLYIDQQRRQTRKGDDLFHLDLACELIARAHPEHAEVARDLRERFYDHIPAPPAELFETVETQDGRVPLWSSIPAGRFLMGSPEDEEGRHDDEGPQHEVVITSPFQLAAVPVTQSQYAAFDPDHRSHHKGAKRPVEGVTWYQAMAFCGWLASHAATSGARLPTEEEWEYASRAGSTTRFWSGDAKSDLERVGWFGEGSSGKTHPVGEKLANPWGLYDVHGNVWEWTLSPWTSNYSEQAKDSDRAVDPAASPADLAGPSPRVPRVYRGGGCWGSALSARAACRFRSDPRFGGMDLGFRVLLPFAPS